MRRFTFFDKEVVTEPGTQQPFTGLGALSVTAVASGRGLVVLGDADGFVHFMNRALQMQSFQAFQVTVTHLVQMRQSNALVAVGSDEEGINPVIKVFNLDKVDHGGAPQQARLIKVLSPKVGWLVGSSKK